MYSQQSRPDGYCGSEYDRFVERNDDTAFGKFKQQYYTAKQAIRSKFGKKEDDFLVASDAELDAKLAVYYSVKNSCESMLLCIERYQDFICELSQEENALGRFLKQKGKADKTQAGKMMSAVGRVQSFTAQQRLALRVPLVRLYAELEVFTERAVGDCHLTVEKTEKARTEYRGSLLWMKKVSEELDPDTYRQLERFRKVQAQVKRKKAKFDKYKLDCLQKVDLLAASRCNLFSLLMANYQNCLLKFWERSSSGHNTVSENFKGYQHYEFTILKDLSEPSRRLAEITSENSTKKTEEAEEALETPSDAEELITLEEQKPVVQENSDMERLLLKDSPDGGQETRTILEDFVGDGAQKVTRPARQTIANQEIPKLPPPPAGVPISGAGKPFEEILSELSMAAGSNQSIPDNQMLEEMLGPGENGAEDTFAFQWQKTFGKNTVSGDGLQDKPTQNPGATIGNSPILSGKGSHGLLPSELLEMGDSLMEPQRGSVINSQKSLSSSQTGMSEQGGKKGQTTKRPQGDPQSGQQKKAAWFSLFADLDPLSNPDAIGKPEGDNNNPC